MASKLKRKQELLLLYYRYKDTPLFAASISILVIIIALILFIKLILPQLQNWFSIRDEVVASRERIKTLTDNQLYITSVNASDLEKNFTTAAAALPFEKDFTGILNAITASTIATGATLDDYSFQVGNLSTKSAQLNQEKSISLELTIQGSLDVLDAFLEEIYRKVPLAEVVEVDYNEGTASLGLVFYYDILTGQQQIRLTDPLVPLSSEHMSLLTQLEEWYEETQSLTANGIQASDSGTLNPF